MLIRTLPLSARLALCSLLLFNLLHEGHSHCCHISSHGNHLIIGHMTSEDQSLEHLEFMRDWIVGDCVVETVNYKVKRNHTITKIEVIDLMPDGCSGSAVLMDGGPGTNFALLRFESQFQKGIKFKVTLYGHRVGRSNNCGYPCGTPPDHGDKTCECNCPRKRGFIIIGWQVEKFESHFKGKLGQS